MGGSFHDPPQTPIFIFKAKWIHFTKWIIKNLSEFPIIVGRGVLHPTTHSTFAHARVD